jgi:hypothetical protein
MMMKKSKQTGLSILAIVILLALAACATSPAATTPAPTSMPVDEATEPLPVEEAPAEDNLLIVDEATGSTSIDEAALETAVALYPASELSSDEVATLLYMREEEKLAHDVYIALYETWGTPVFQNIAGSEQTHTDSIRLLLDQYGLDDPAATTAPGVFVDQTLQALYDQLVATGSESLSSALRVGAAIEEIDIIDLQEAIDGADNADIILVYQNLMKGSRNHLRAFVSTLDQQVGEGYQPQYLDQVTYDEIVNSDVERGGPNRGG